MLAFIQARHTRLMRTKQGEVGVEAIFGRPITTCTCVPMPESFWLPAVFVSQTQKKCHLSGSARLKWRDLSRTVPERRATCYWGKTNYWP